MNKDVHIKLCFNEVLMIELCRDINVFFAKHDRT